MKNLVFCLLLVSGTAQFAQSARATSDPVTSTMRGLTVKYRNNFIWAAKEMPAEKYRFKPTPTQISFAGLLIEVVESNDLFCSTAAGIAKPASGKLKKDSDKKTLIAALESSFDFCAHSLAMVHDKTLGDIVRFTREMEAPRVGALFGLTEEWADAYRISATYLRSNGLNPPTAAVRN